MKKWLWVVGCIFYLPVFGQLQYSQDREIVKLAVNSDKTLLATLDPKKITILNTLDFSLVRSWDHHLPVSNSYSAVKDFKYSMRLFEFHPTQPNLLLFQSVQHLNSFACESPLDSIFIVNITDPSKRSGVPGNFRFHYLDENNFVSS